MKLKLDLNHKLVVKTESIVDERTFSPNALITLKDGTTLTIVYNRIDTMDELTEICYKEVIRYENELRLKKLERIIEDLD